MGVKINYISLFVYAALLFCFTALLIVFSGAIFFSDKGFELSDETYYLFYSNNFKTDTYITTNFGILNNFFCFGHASLINLRLAKLFYQTIAVLLFVFSLFRYLDHEGYELNKLQKAFITIIALMTSYINYDYLPMTMSYNTWSLILMLLCFSVILFEFTNTKLLPNLISALVFGFICFCLFLVKFPNAIFAGLIYLIVNLFLTKNNLLFKVFALLLGVIIGYCIFLNDHIYLQNILHNYYVTLFEVKHTSADSYVEQVKEIVLICSQKKYILIELLIILTAILIKKFTHHFKYGFAYLVFVINFQLTIVFVEGNSQVLYNDFLAACLFIINGFLFVYLFGGSGKHVAVKRSSLWLAIFLLVMPFCLMLGTNNPFYYTSSQTMVFAFLGIIMLMIFKRLLSVQYLALMSFAVCAFVLNVLYTGGVKSPYRQENLCEKKYPLQFNNQISGIYESYERFVDYTALNYLMGRFNKPKTKVLTFFDHFGLEYITDSGIYPDSPITDAEHLMAYNEYVLTRYGLSDRFNILVLPKQVNNTPAFYKLFKTYGIMPGENYKLVYSYKFRSNDEMVFIYKHI